MADLKLTLACWNYDRTRALMDGSVRPQGIELTYLNLFVAEAFQRMMRDHEFEVSELGLTFYIGSLDLEDPPFVAIPVFPLRFFSPLRDLCERRERHRVPAGPDRQKGRRALHLRTRCR